MHEYEKLFHNKELAIPNHAEVSTQFRMFTY